MEKKIKKTLKNIFHEKYNIPYRIGKAYVTKIIDFVGDGNIENLSPYRYSDFLVSLCNGFREKPAYNKRKDILLYLDFGNYVWNYDFKKEKVLAILDKPFPVSCPYCNIPARYVDSSYVYASGDYGMFYQCPFCKARVGVHKETTIPLGTMANRQLQKMRLQVHTVFDKYWKAKDWKRKKAYEWLAEKMNMEEAHIGSFNENDCVKALALF